MTATLLVRADSAAAIGAGHVMRCLALAQGWQDAGGDVTLAAASLDGTLRRRLIDEGVVVVDLDTPPGSRLDAEATVHHARQAGAEWVVADGYNFDAAYQRCIHDAGLKLLVLDDYGHAEHYHADLVLNLNLGADESLYANRGPATQLLLGTRYALLRRDFRQHSDHERSTPPVARRLLVTFGGSDPHDLTAMAIRAIHSIDEPRLVTTVIAASEDLKTRLGPLAADGPQQIEVLGHVTDMADHMVRADLAIAAAGRTSWERALLKLPSLVVTIAENQRSIAEALQRAGAATDLGWWRDVREDTLAEAIRDTAQNEPLRRQQAASAGRIVDGRGAQRVVQAMSRSRTMSSQSIADGADE